MHKTNNFTLYRQSLKERILTTAMHDFIMNGIKAVKMDNIAMELPISKRTLYEIFANKEDLLFACINRGFAESREHMTEFDNGEHSVMDIIIEFYHLKIKEFSTTNPLFYTELHKYPKIVSYMDNLHQEEKKNTLDFFRRGITEGFFRDDVNYEIIVRIGKASMNYVMSSMMYKEFTLQEIFKNVIFVFIRSLCTQKGMDVLDNFLHELTADEK
jgi:AcrR family transcriptional regulator